MKQMLRIFLKDLRHFWIEVAFLLAVVAGFAWVYPQRWSGHASNPSPEWSMLAGLLKLLIVVGWWLLISGAIHDESLVGDRQFWVTRPYERRYLLAAKALFIFCFVYVPVFLMQLSILAQAGFQASHYIPNLLYNLVLLTAFCILPAAALATVTSNLVRLTLTILGVCLGFVATVSIALVLTAKGVLQTSVPTKDFLSVPTVMCLLAAVIAVQYGARRVALSRAMLLALPPVLLLYTGIFSSTTVVDHTYPALAPGNSAPFSISVRQDAPTNESLRAFASKNLKKIEVYIPVRVSDGAEDAVWSGSGVRIRIRGQGVDWQSGWQGMYSAYYRDGQDSWFRFALDREVFERVQPVPVTLQVTLALNQARRASVWTAPVSEQDLRVPGFGICSPLVLPSSAPGIVQISCRYPLREPDLTLVQAEWSQGPCPAAGMEASGWAGTMASAAADLGISPVEENPIWFSQTYETGLRGPNAVPHICPGTPVTFTRYKYAGRLRAEFTLQNFQFPHYQTEQGGTGSFGVFVR